jgi:hypothetical protein
LVMRAGFAAFGAERFLVPEALRLDGGLDASLW